jgi:hypothetical protein
LLEVTTTCSISGGWSGGVVCAAAETPMAAPMVNIDK